MNSEMGDPSSSEEYFERGDAYRMEGEHDKAIADFSHILALAESDDYDDYTDYYVYGYGYAETLQRRGLTYAEQGNFDKAIEDYGEVIRLDPEDSLAYNYRGNAYFGKGDLDRAIEDYDKAIQVAEELLNEGRLSSDFIPNKALMYFDRGLAYAEKGDFNRAIADYSETVRLDPDFTDVYELRAEAYEELSDNAKAAEDWDRAAESSRE